MSERFENDKRPFAEEHLSGLNGEKGKLFDVEDASFSRPGQGKGLSHTEFGRKEDILYREKYRDHVHFELYQKIGALTYCFKIFKKPRGEVGQFGINIETEEYDFALTQMNKEEQDEYFATIKAMVDTINAESPIIAELVISTAGQGYTAREIEACKKELLAQDRTLTQSKLDRMYGHQILEKYEELNQRPFPLERSEDPKGEGESTPLDVRRRFFRIHLKKYFPDWEIRDGYADRDFSLVKKDRT